MSGPGPTAGAGATRPATAERAGWITLALLLFALAVTAAVSDRRDWSGFLGDEATYLMAAESLAFDLDLYYDQGDFDRFVEHWQRPPEGLILQSGDRGASLTYGKPFFYPAWIAPFTRWSPTRGPFVANALLLGVAAWLAARVLRHRLGGAAPWWMAAFVFASAVFTYVFWAHADLFLMSLTAIALALLFDPRPTAWRQGVAGALLAAVVFSRPVYGPVLVAAFFALPRGRRFRAAAALAAGVVIVVGGAVAAHQITADSWTAYDGDRGGFYSRTGFPAVDFPAAEWGAALERAGNMAWGGWIVGQGSERERARLAGWNLLYLLAGRHVGLLPYFLPLLLPFVAGPRGPARWALLGAVAVSVAGVLLLRPFNFYGGGAAIANRYFLPLAPAIWFVVARRRSAVWAALAALAALPFLWPLWLQGPAEPRRADLSWRYPSPAAIALLPYETTQSHLKPSGQEDVIHNGLWLKPLVREVRVVEPGLLALLPGAAGEILLGAARPLSALTLELTSPGVADPVFDGRTTAAATGRPGVYRLELGGTTASHPMWWTADRYLLYRLRFRFPDATEPVLFSLRPAPARGP